MYCDLHIHSIYSDGSFPPADLIREAARLGLTVALTDHNTVAGLPEFLKAAEEYGVTAVPGIELSTDHNGHELHLVGLFVAPQHYAMLERVAKEFHVLKEISNIELVERLNNAGYEIDYFSVKKRNPTGNANRAHVAAELLEKGYVNSIKEAFQTLLHDDAGFYVPPERLQLTDAIRTLRQIGALPILAHPLQDLDEQTLRSLLPLAIDCGLLGLETRHSSYSRDQIALAEQIAQEYGLLPSGGSDFHGASKPNVRLGVGTGDLTVPLQIYHDLLEKHRTMTTQ